MKTLLMHFNYFFVNKISTLKQNIDTKHVEDPLSNLEEKMKKKKNKPSLSIKQIKPKDIKAAFKLSPCDRSE